MINLNINEDFAEYHSLGEKNLFLKFEDQKKNIDKKIHIFQVFNFLKNIQKMLDEKEFLNSGVHFLVLTNYHDYDFGYLIQFKTLDENQKEINNHEPNDNDNYIPIYDKLTELFDNISLDYFCSDDFKEKDDRTFSIDKYLVENLKQLLLNDELKAVFDYAFLDNSLSKNEYQLIKNKI